MVLLTMSGKEISGIEVVKEVLNKRLKQKEAASILDSGVRQLQRLIKAYNTSGDEGLISGNRDRPSNRRYPESIKE